MKRLLNRDIEREGDVDKERKTKRWCVTRQFFEHDEDKKNDFVLIFQNLLQ